MTLPACDDCGAPEGQPCAPVGGCAVRCGARTCAWCGRNALDARHSPYCGDCRGRMAETFNETLVHGRAAGLDVATLAAVTCTARRLAREGGQDPQEAGRDVMQSRAVRYDDPYGWLYRIDGLILEWVDE